MNTEMKKLAQSNRSRNAARRLGRRRQALHGSQGGTITSAVDDARGRRRISTHGGDRVLHLGEQRGVQQGRARLLDARRAPDRRTRTDHTSSASPSTLAFGGLAIGLAAVALALMRMRDEKRSPYYRIGTAPGVEQPVQGAPSRAFRSWRRRASDFVLNFGPGIGDMQHGSKTLPLPELIEWPARPSSVVGAFELTIPDRVADSRKLGQTSFVVTAVAKPRRHAAPLFAGLERRTVGYFMGSLGAHLDAAAARYPSSPARPFELPHSRADDDRLRASKKNDPTREELAARDRATRRAKPKARR